MERSDMEEYEEYEEHDDTTPRFLRLPRFPRYPFVMWFPLALLSAFSFSLLWVLTRVSRGIPSGIVTAVQFLPGPLLLLWTSRSVDFPWGESWWSLYLLFLFLLMPVMQGVLTYAVHSMELTLLKPLFGLSSLATLLTSVLLFREPVSVWGVLGVILIAGGLLILYSGRWSIWWRGAPWLTLLAALIFGINAAIAKNVVMQFPHVLAIASLGMTASLTVNGLPALGKVREMQWSRRTILLLIAIFAAFLSQDLLSLTALTLGPSSYVIAVKRTSVLLTAVLGYVFLHERDQSLLRLLLSGGLVVVGVLALTL